MIIDVLQETEPSGTYANIGPPGMKLRIELSYATIENDEWVECNLGACQIPSLDMFVSSLDIELEDAVTEEGLPAQRLNITGLVHKMERDYGTRRQTTSDAGTGPVE